MSTLQQASFGIHQQLARLYPDTEIESFIRILFKHYLGMSPAEIHLSGSKEITAGSDEQIQAAVAGLKKFRPIQYIIGETEFYGLKFKVDSNVLIPRPETEELVDWIVKEYSGGKRNDLNMNIVDIGTGSGCIAVSLAVNFPCSDVWIMDVSGEALACAQNNATANGARIYAGILGSILGNDFDRLFGQPVVDIIVSNPPYISQAEKQQMQPNVLEYEPQVALFPPGDDPLIFYRRIAAFGMQCLNNGGKLFFEINENYPDETSAILKESGYSDVSLRKDINGKWRMVSAMKQ